MFCPQCGTKAMGGNPRFCRECGAELGVDARQADPNAVPGSSERTGTGGTSSSSPFQRPILLARVIEKDSTVKALLIVGGILLLLPLVIPLVFGTLLAGLVAGAAVVALAFKLAPVVAIGILVYWLATRRRHAYHGRC